MADTSDIANALIAKHAQPAKAAAAAK